MAKAQHKRMMIGGVVFIVGLLIVGLLTAYLAPIFIDELTAVDTAGWGEAETSLFELLPLFFVLAIFLYVIAWALIAAGVLD